MYNKITLLGNFTRDIEIRYSAGGAAIGNTAIATSHKFKGADGQQKEEVCFVDLTFFGRTAEIANQYLRKGSRVLVDGRLKLEQWKAQDGTNRSKHVVIVNDLKMLGEKQHGEATTGNNMDDENRHNAGGNMNRPPNGETAARAAQPNAQPTARPQAQTTIPEIDINDEDIPF